MLDGGPDPGYRAVLGHRTTNLDSRLIRVLGTFVGLATTACPAESPDSGSDSAAATQSTDDDAEADATAAGSVTVGTAASGSSSGSAPSSTDGADATTAGVDASTTGSEEPLCGAMGFLDSLATWEEARDNNGDTYWYFGERSSGICGGSFACCVTDTLIVVEAGVVTRRQKLEPENVGGLPEGCGEGWEEVGDDVGTHIDDELAAPAWTMDEVYASCCADVLSDLPRGATPHVQYEDGILELCGTDDDGCAKCPLGGPDEWGGAQIRIDALGFDDPPDVL